MSGDDREEAGQGGGGAGRGQGREGAGKVGVERWAGRSEPRLVISLLHLVLVDAQRVCFRISKRKAHNQSMHTLQVGAVQALSPWAVAWVVARVLSDTALALLSCHCLSNTDGVIIILIILP